MRFKARNNLHNIILSDESASGDDGAACAFPESLARIIENCVLCSASY